MRASRITAPSDWSPSSCACELPTDTPCRMWHRCTTGKTVSSRWKGHRTWCTLWSDIGIHVAGSSRVGCGVEQGATCTWHCHYRSGHLAFTWRITWDHVSPGHLHNYRFKQVGIAWLFNFVAKISDLLPYSKDDCIECIYIQRWPNSQVSFTQIVLEMQNDINMFIIT